MSNRIDQKFAELRAAAKSGFIVYITAGIRPLPRRRNRLRYFADKAAGGSGQFGLVRSKVLTFLTNDMLKHAQIHTVA